MARATLRRSSAPSTVKRSIFQRPSAASSMKDETRVASWGSLNSGRMFAHLLGDVDLDVQGIAAEELGEGLVECGLHVGLDEAAGALIQAAPGDLRALPVG